MSDKPGGYVGQAVLEAGTRSSCDFENVDSGEFMSRRDFRTEPGVLTPGGNKKAAPPLSSFVPHSRIREALRLI